MVVSLSPAPTLGPEDGGSDQLLVETLHVNTVSCRGESVVPGSRLEGRWFSCVSDPESLSADCTFIQDFG